jgi:hypothetical protein
MDPKGLLEELKALAKAMEKDPSFAEKLEKASNEEFEELAKAKIYNMQGKMTADTGEPDPSLATWRANRSKSAGLKIAEPKKEEPKAPEKTPADLAIETKEKRIAAGKSALGKRPSKKKPAASKKVS